MKQSVMLHCGFRTDRPAKMIMTLSAKFDTSKSWHHHHEEIPEANTELDIWFYGEHDLTTVLKIVRDIKKAILNNSFVEWIQW